MAAARKNATIRRGAKKVARAKTNLRRKASRATKTVRAKARRTKTQARRAETQAKSAWSQAVSTTSHALDVSMETPLSIAASLKKAADRAWRHKAEPFEAALAMLNFYVTRGEKNLTAARKLVLSKAKAELRKLYGPTPAKRRRAKA